MSIDASTVMELRRITGAGMMDCKKYLLLADGDMKLAEIKMREAGQAKADNKSSRVAAEGVIVLSSSDSLHDAVMIEVNSETDFVARDENFTNFTTQAVQTALKISADSINTLSEATLIGSDMTVESARKALVAKIGENIQLRRIARLHSDDVVGCYLHGTRIGVVVALKNGDETLAKNIAMHIAASKPQVVSPEEVSADLIDSERNIFRAQASESGKPQEIIEKMIDGRISKFLDEVCLLGQPYVKDPSKKISQLLKEHQAEVISFVRFEVGEGIEKKEDNFVEEVMAQVREK